tara:strand:- start:923 stop:1258 length:336 start_codon:yes stop_codon:yes gene_type:complete
MGEVISFIDKIKNLFVHNQEPKEVRYLRGKPFELKEIPVAKPFQYPDYCQETYDFLNKNGTMKSIKEIMKATGKTKLTVHHEMSQIRKSGIEILKHYDKDKKEYLYFFPGD